jgi:hypothetical protein
LVCILRANRLLRTELKNESASDKIVYFAMAHSIISKVSLLALVFPVSLLLQYFPLPPAVYSFCQKLLNTIYSAAGHLLLFSLLLNKDNLLFGLRREEEALGSEHSIAEIPVLPAAAEPAPAAPAAPEPEASAEVLEPQPAKLSADVEEKKREVYAAMETGKYYLQPDLTLNYLAAELSWSRTNLSFVINKGVCRQNKVDF